MKLFDFSYKKSVQETVLFYFIMLIFGSVLGAIIGVSYSLSIGSKDYVGNTAEVGAIFSPLYCLLFSFFIMQQKKMIKNIKALLIALVSVLLANWTGLLFALIPVAVLFSMNPENPSAEEKEEDEPQE